MNKLKINVDRPKMSSKDISNRMNFEGVLSSHKIMAKPFYKSTWFFGVTGLATVSLIAGSMYTLNQEGDELYRDLEVADMIPLIRKEVDLTENKIVKLNLNEVINTEQPIEEKTTLKKESLKTEKKNRDHSLGQLSSEVVADDIKPEPVSKVANESLNELPKTFSFMDLHPRISGKLDGGITKGELMNDNGIITNSDVKIISFQLHLVNGMTSKVFDSNGNKLNAEMKLAIEKVNVGEEIYFEKIKGKATTGEVFRLSPIKYVLLN